MKRLLILSLLPCCSFLSAQEFEGGPINVGPNGIVNGTYLNTHIPTKRLMMPETVREADVIWSKRVWRTIDLREKINHVLYYPLDEFDSEGQWVTHSDRWSLWTIIRHNVLKGNLRMFSPYNPYQFTLTDGDQFKYPIAPSPGKNFYNDQAYQAVALQYLGKLGPQPIIPYATVDGIDSTIINPDGTVEFVYPPRDTIWYMSKDIIEYHVKEDWFFDKERSMLDVRIIGICPVVYNTDENGQITGKRELFWLYFPHCRYLFNNYYVYNEHNDAQWMSFDDLFWKRRFSSTIYKESNVFDRNVETYRTGVDALIESERINEGIRNFEHDVWHF